MYQLLSFTFIVSFIAFIIFWRKQREARKVAGADYETNEAYISAGKRKQLMGIIAIISSVVGASMKGLETIDVVKNLFAGVCAVTFFMFLYYWRKKSSARKAAGENYLQDEKYLHISKIKKIVGYVCLVAFVLGGVIPNSEAEKQRSAERVAAYKAKKAEEELQKSVEKFKEGEKKAKAKKSASNSSDKQEVKAVFEEMMSKGGNEVIEIVSINIQGDRATVHYKFRGKGEAKSVVRDGKNQYKK